jgi:menaquinone-dependent protoporphyrinogen IX oxidase
MFCNTVKNWGILEWENRLIPVFGKKLSMNDLRWTDFVMLTIRSLGTIMISTIKNIKDTYREE